MTKNNTPRIPRPTTNCEYCGRVQLYPVCRECAKKNSKARAIANKPKTDQHNNNTKYYRSVEWRTLRQAAINRDYNQCVTCSSQHRLTVHHITPRKQGGEDALHNLVTLCHSCHSRVEAGNRTTAIRLEQYLQERPR